jgi:putative peptidoglycan lipid II flippase
MLYALLTGYWPGAEATGQYTALPLAPRHKGRVCTPRQVRGGVPAILDAITYRALRGQAADAPLRAQTPAGLAMALRMVQRPSYQLDEAVAAPPVRVNRSVPQRHARHARAGLRHRTTLLRPAV